MSTRRATARSRADDNATSRSIHQPTEDDPSEVASRHQENVFVFVPNLIGYLRVVFAVCALYFMPLHPRRCGVLYSVSCLLDALDGFAARHFNQSTRFGAVLDMVTDRCTTSCLLVFLAIAQPAYALVFQGLISMDFASHYMHMYATLAMGGEGQSHKSVSVSRSRIMNFYYKKWVLFTCCAGNELFFIGLYLLCFSSPTASYHLMSTKGPPVPIELGTSSSSPFSAAAMEIARADKINDTVPWILTVGSAPIMLFKQCINVLQLVKASQWLAEGDRREREKLRRART